MSRGGQRHYYKQMRFQQLQGFCETARRHSLAAAAAVLRLSRTAVWHQIRALEREVATPLIQRKGRGVELTEDGRLLLELVEPLVSSFASIPTLFADRKALVHRRLRVASNPPLYANQFRDVVCEFRARYPQVHLTLMDGTSPEVLRMVEQGEVDLAVTGLIPGEPDSPLLQYEPLFADPFVLICPRNHELACKRIRRLDTLRRYPFVLMAPGTLTRQRVERVFREHGIWERFKVVMETTSFALVLEYVALDMGISIISHDTRKGPWDRLHAQSAARWFGEETTALVWKKGIYQTEYVRALCDITRRLLANPSGESKKES